MSVFNHMFVHRAVKDGPEVPLSGKLSPDFWLSRVNGCGHNVGRHVGNKNQPRDLPAVKGPKQVNNHSNTYQVVTREVKALYCAL